MYNLLLTHNHVPLGEGGTCIHTGTVNPTSLCYALLYPLSRPPAYCSSSRGVETLPPYRVFFPSFPCLEQTFFAHCFSVSVPEKKKRVIDTVQRSPTKFYFYFCFPFSAHAALQPTRGRLETCLCKGREERKGEGSCLMDHSGLSGC